MPKKTYRTGKPSILDRLFGGYPEAYAYSRFTREPIVFHDQPYSEKELGRHSDFPVLGGIDVDISRGDPQKTLLHEQMHHAFPTLMSEKDQHRYIAPLEHDDPNVRRTGESLLPPEADLDLLRKLLRSQDLRQSTK